jgi:hypothetical protein
MKRMYVVILIVLLPIVLSAQDKIFLKDGGEQQGKIIEILPATIKYTPLESEVIFHLAKENVHYILFEDGTKFEFKEATASEKRAAARELFQHKHILSFNLYEFSENAGVEIDYDYFFPKGYFALRPSVAYSPQSLQRRNTYYDEYHVYKIYHIGIAAILFPFGQEKRAWYIGGTIARGAWERPYWDEKDGNLPFTGFAGIAGMYFHRFRRFSTLIELGMGIKNIESSYGGMNNEIWFPVKMNICYKF